MSPGALLLAIGILLAIGALGMALVRVHMARRSSRRR
jgi:hypothetical protein